MALAKKRCCQRYSYKQKKFFHCDLQTASEERNFASVIHQSPVRYFSPPATNVLPAIYFIFASEERYVCQRHSLSPAIYSPFASDIHCASESLTLRQQYLN
jgi:hypothetical protein